MPFIMFYFPLNFLTTLKSQKFSILAILFIKTRANTKKASLKVLNNIIFLTTSMINTFYFHKISLLNLKTDIYLIKLISLTIKQFILTIIRKIIKLKNINC